MADKKKLLEEASVRKFMKIAGLSSQSDAFVKKTLKEENRGERTFDPHDEDPRHENLKEDKFETDALGGKEHADSRNADGGKDRPGDVREELELEEEGQDLDEDLEEEGKDLEEESMKGKIAGTGPGKDIQSGTGMSGAGKKPTKKIQFETMKGKIAGTGPGKDIQSGTGMSGAGKKPTKKIQYEEVEEEGKNLNEFGEQPNSMGGGESEMPPMGDEPGDGVEPDGDEGSPNIAGLVRAIAAAIEAETGVQVSVEGGGSDDEMGQEEVPQEPTDDQPPEEEHNPLDEEGMYGYESEDPAAKMKSGGMNGMRESKNGTRNAKKAPQKQTQTSQNAKAKANLVETITKNVLAKLANAASVKKKTNQGTAPKAKR